MKPEKRENLIKKQKYIALINRNRKVNKITIIILGFGLLLMLGGLEDIGSIIVWIGIVLFIFVMLSNVVAKMMVRKLG